MTKPEANETSGPPGPDTGAIVDTGKAVEPPGEPLPKHHEEARHGKHKRIKADSVEYESLKKKAADAETYYDQLLRARAEFDNYRRRVAQEKQYADLVANEKLFQKLLPVLDTFDIALANAEQSNSTQAILEGVKMVQAQFKAALKDSGLEEVDALRSKFDPHLHEAIQQVEAADCEEGTVVQQVRKGYKFRDRLLRPATVVVSKKPEPPQS